MILSTVLFLQSDQFNQDQRNASFILLPDLDVWV